MAGEGVDWRGEANLWTPYHYSCAGGGHINVWNTMKIFLDLGVDP
jgi:hypothetical protein